jgi:Mrp family chromosome partitioning ATPase
VSKYYEAMRRLTPARTEEADDTFEEALVDVDESSRSHAIVPLPAGHRLLGALSRSDEIRSLCERIAPMAVVENSVRLLVSGCSPGDGASTVAASLAFDLSQRLSLETLLVDAHLRHPSLHRLFMRGPRSPEVVLDGALQMRPTGWPRLELATCCLSGAEDRRTALAQLEDRLGAFPAAVIDLGVTRLDSRMLPLARPHDPILLVVRYGSTRRQEVATTAAALRAANRTLAGAILNAAVTPTAHHERNGRNSKRQ